MLLTLVGTVEVSTVSANANFKPGNLALFIKNNNARINKSQIYFREK